MAHVTGAIFSLCVFAPLFWMMIDREPPFIRLHGVIIPDTVERGGNVAVRYVTTRRIRRDCPGVVQQEIVDSQNTIYSKLARDAQPARWEPDPSNPDQEIFTGNPVSVPLQAAPGLALFRSVTFRYCNWLQRALHWPIVQSGPDLYFTILETVAQDAAREQNAK